MIKQAQMKKQTSSGLNAMTEAKLAQRVGHLEMLKGGKKDKKKDGDGSVLKSGGVKGAHGTARK